MVCQDGKIALPVDDKSPIGRRSVVEGMKVYSHQIQ